MDSYIPSDGKTFPKRTLNLFCCVVHIRNPKKKIQTFELVFEQPAIGECLGEEGNEGLEFF
jgi:hypothetical protein